VQSTEERIQTNPNIVKRIFAGFVDYLMVLAFLFVYISAFGTRDEEGFLSISDHLILGPVVFWFLMTVGTEQFFGATLGNMLVDLKPISTMGYQQGLTLGQSFKRHFLDPFDMFFFGLIGIMTIKLSKQNQRLGDLWAQTIVVDTRAKKKIVW
jgi:uncharacterized RDD family membrane protein YckC